MTDPTRTTQLDEQLDDLFNEVRRFEGTLSGGTSLGKGAQAIQNFRKTEIRLGDPRNRLIRLTPELFTDLKLELDAVNKAQMASQFHFYYLTLSVNMQAVEGVQFSQISSAMDFSPKDANQPIIASIFPSSEWKDVFNWGGALKFGLDGSLNWKAGVALTPEMQAALQVLSPEAQAKISGENQIKSFIEMPDYAFTVGRSEIVATGPGDSTCSWEITKPSLKKQHTMEFGMVFKAPQSVRKIQLTGEAAAEVNYPWLTAQLGQVLRRLSDYWKRIFTSPSQELKDEERLRLHPAERWELDLPV